jgi:hypothetical protein
MFGYDDIVKPDQASRTDFISGNPPRFALQKRAVAGLSRSDLSCRPI